MANTLIIVTFLAGSTWGPAVTVTATASAAACEVLQVAAADSILSTAKTNVQLAEITRYEKEIVVTAGQSRRIMATLKCN